MILWKANPDPKPVGPVLFGIFMLVMYWVWRLSS